MPVTIEKTFRFDAGHRALGFPDKREETLHGHTWTLRLVVESTGKLDAYKTVFDTNELSRIVKPIIKRVDHSFIVWSADPLYERIVELCRAGGIEHALTVVDFNPTIEGIVEHYFKMIRALLPDNVRLRSAALDASATLRSTYEE